MPAVAEVQFKAVNSQQVVTAFKTVGTAASDSSQKIQQNSNAMKTMGQGMKSSISGIAQVGTAFATLSLSVVNTWRAYRDLGDAQIAVDRANLKVKKTQDAIAKTEKDIAALRKEGAKGGLEYALVSGKIRVAEQKLAKDRKEGKKTAAELHLQELEIEKMREEGTGTTGKLKEAEEKLALQKEQLGIQTEQAGEAQERFNDTQQDFYLSILPTALSGMSTLSLAFSGMKGMFSGPGGLVGMFGPLGIAIAGISVAIVAFKTNFLGVRDVVMGVIDFVKSQFGDWQKTIQEVFGLIQKGDWGGAFQRITKAAQDFWNYLVTHVPFFGGMNKIISALKSGNWAAAFDVIKNAAASFWEALKKEVPFFAGAQKFFEQLFAGDFSGAWKTLTSGITSAWAAIVKAVPLLGDIATYLRTKFELASATAKSSFNAMANELTKAGGAFDNIQQGLAKIGSGDVGGGVGQMVTGINQGIEQVKNAINNWVLSNFGINLKTLEGQAKDIGLKLMGWIGNAMTFVSTEFIDPLLTSLFKPESWLAHGKSQGENIAKIGSSLVAFITGAMAKAAQGGDAEITLNQANTALNIWAGISKWMETNLPDFTALLRAVAQGIADALGSAADIFKNVGSSIWNGIIEGIKVAIAGFDPTGALRGALDKLKVDIPVNLDTKEGQATAAEFKNSIKWMDVPKTVKANAVVTGQQSVDKLGRSIQALKNRVVTVTTVFRQVGNQAVARGRATGGQGIGARITQHGYMGTVKRPTLFLAGEGGRQEDISINPRGSSGRGGHRAGGSHITISFQPAEFAQFLRYKIIDNSGVSK